jgi:hypothetical protein
MEITQMVAELATQRDQINQAIAVLEQLAQLKGASPRRGRPRKDPLAEVTQQLLPKRRGRPPGSKKKNK